MNPNRLGMIPVVDSPSRVSVEVHHHGKENENENALEEEEDKQNQTKRTCSKKEAERGRVTSSHMRTDQSL